jgi:hypothetical protein
MGKRPDKSVGNGEKSEPGAIKASAGDSAGTASDTPQAQAIDSNLPVVEAPKLDGGEAMVPSGVEIVNEVSKLDGGEAMAPLAVETGNEPPKLNADEPMMPPDSEAVDETPSPPVASAPAPSARFALLAATIALTAALGSFFGSLTASGVIRLLPAGDAKTATTADASDVLQAMRTQLAELSVLKANIDGASRSANSQFAKIADRLDRLDKRSLASAETTGSIAAAPPPAAEPKLPILDGWIVQDVQNGRALVATRNGGVFEVGPGSFLPGIGRVETVKREDGKWIVVTAHGLISSMR